MSYRDTAEYKHLISHSKRIGLARDYWCVKGYEDEKDIFYLARLTKDLIKDLIALDTRGAEIELNYAIGEIVILEDYHRGVMCKGTMGEMLQEYEEELNSICDNNREVWDENSIYSR